MADDSFSAAWLELREPADHRSRSSELAEALAVAAVREGWSTALDLGAGTGSNLRYLAPKLPCISSWTLLDHDADLLARAAAASRSSDGSVEDAGGERTERLVRALHGDLAQAGLAAVDAADVVVASALLDLVSEAWLHSLVERCATRGRGALFALTYDGAIEWRDGDHADALVHDAVDRHQARDKGLGHALGPRAPGVARELFRSAGYQTHLRSSPWELAGAADAALAAALVRGWESAAVEVRPEHEGAVRAWAERRLAAVRSGAYAMRVGHQDLLALPPARPRSAGAAR